MNRAIGRKFALLASVSALSVTPAYAQDSAPAEEEEVEEVIVVGSHIKGAKVTEMLPVSVLDAGDIETTGTISGNELFRSIPQMGFQAVNNEDTSGGINAARGDVASINLRAMGTGNTLMLLNGRRMVLHPGYQTENLVPVTTVNTNTIPIMGVQRIELLLGGAAAIYGADAVGGVINTVLEDDYEGITGELRYGFEEGTSLAETQATMKAGFTFNEGKTHLLVFGNYFDRNGVWASDRERFASRDLRPFLEGDPDWEGDSQFNNTSSWNSWGRFNTEVAAYDDGGQRLTTSSGRFHVQPVTESGCRINIGASGMCIDDSSHSSNQRYDWNPVTKMSPDIERINAFSYLTHDFDNGMEFYSEAGYYNAKSVRELYQGSVLGSHRFWVPASSYWNPFGPATLADGSPNPNRLAGLDIADEGLDIFVDRYRPIDAGTRNVNVTLESYRFVAGLRGNLGDWDFDTGFVQSESKSTDTTNRVSNTLFTEWISRTDPSAYNLWNGGDPDNLSGQDTNPASDASLEGIMVDVTRIGKTSLTLIDFKVSRPDLFSLPAGDVGAAFGAEYRRESYSDDRDDRLDGTITFTDPVMGTAFGSDVLGSSPTNDSNGNRNVKSVFAELAIPLLRDWPLIESLDVQVAARYEDLSDVGDTFKPKIGMSWYPMSSIQFRGSWSKGFRAPNLPQINETSLSRVNTRTDYIRCAAVEIKNPEGGFDCGDQSLGVESRRSGSKDLISETIDNKSIGLTFQPEFIPGLTFTADWWRIEQSDLVSIFTDANAIRLDYMLRVTEGSTNPNVVRSPANLDDIELFDGTGLEPAGEVLYVLDPYQNLESRVVKGMDFGLYYDFEIDKVGDFKFKANVAKLNEFFQSPSADAQRIIDAKEAGLIDQSIDVAGAGSLMQRNSRPKWRWSSSLRWTKGDFGVNLHGSYIDWVWDTGADLGGDQSDVYWKVKSHFKMNTSIDYSINDKARLRIGVNNLFDKLPPLADESFGYNSDLHSARGRYIYGSIRFSM